MDGSDASGGLDDVGVSGRVVVAVSAADSACATFVAGGCAVADTATAAMRGSCAARGGGPAGARVAPGANGRAPAGNAFQRIRIAAIRLAYQAARSRVFEW